MITRLHDPNYPRWAAQIRATGGCRQPIHLRGHIDHIDRATGELLHRYSTRTEPDRILRLPCKTRRASRCPTCAEVYRADTYQLIRAGLAGGKGVPTSVTGHPCLFATLTAPSFGAVHTRRWPSAPDTAWMFFFASTPSASTASGPTPTGKSPTLSTTDPQIPHGPGSFRGRLHFAGPHVTLNRWLII
ncbi:replication initiator [Streptosporangium subroseum]|uniref:replication initiator n=1 Tax=Streptosporangium subroseum TaxID=106412 RepID=UPI00352D9D4B